MGAALFLNVDLDLYGGDAVARVLDAIGERVVVLNQTSTFASVEVLEQPATIDAAIETFAALVASLGHDARVAWSACERRVLSVGIQGGSAHSTAFRLTPPSLASVVAMGAEIEFVVYAAPAPAGATDSRGDAAAPIGDRSRSEG